MITNKQKNIIKKLSMFLLVLVIGGLGTHLVFASNVTGRTISIFSTEGDSVNISRNGRYAVARDGQRLNEGNLLITGANSSATLSIDDASLVKMNEHSVLGVNSSRNNLSLDLQSGNALVDVQNQAPDQSLEVRVGARGFTVRGTMFTIGFTPEGYTIIVMLSGAGEIEDKWIESGDMLLIRPSIVVGEYIHELIHGFRMDEVDKFTLKAILDNEDYLVNEVGTLTESDIIEASILHDDHVRWLEAEQATADIANDDATVGHAIDVTDREVVNIIVENANTQLPLNLLLVANIVIMVLLIAMVIIIMIKLLKQSDK